MIGRGDRRRRTVGERRPVVVVVAGEENMAGEENEAGEENMTEAAEVMVVVEKREMGREGELMVETPTERCRLLATRLVARGRSTVTCAIKLDTHLIVAANWMKRT